MKCARWAIVTFCLLAVRPLPAQEPGLPCSYDDKHCARSALGASPARKLSFWEKALAKPVEQRIGAGPPELLTHLALDNIANGFPNKPRAAHLSEEFLEDVRIAFAELPESVRRMAAGKLAGIYFAQDIGSTGFTDQVYGPDGQPKASFIILDPLVLQKQTANGWATWKENTPFRPDSSMRLEAQIERSADDHRRNAIQYILLHELGHVLSIGENFHPNWNLPVAKVSSTVEFPFFQTSWTIDKRAGLYMSAFDYAFPQRRDVVYYFGARLPGSEMLPVYERLEETSFATLYAATHPADDFAEAFASYVHVEMLKRPFEIRIYRDEKLAKTYASCWNFERCAAKRGMIERFLGIR